MNQTMIRLNLILGLLISSMAIGCSNSEQAPASNGLAKKESSNASPMEPGKSRSKSNSKSSSNEEPQDAPVVNDERFHEGLLAAAEEYLRFPMVNEIALVAPEDCAPPDEEARPRMSNSDDEFSHGKKLYYLFAKNITHYLSPQGTDAPVGQTLVKESWTSKPSNADARNMRNHASGIRINPRAVVGDKVLAIGQRQDLFVMMKLDPKTENTDQGWVYGTVDADSKKVTSAGKVASCIQCHESAKNDRLFGPASE